MSLTQVPFEKSEINGLITTRFRQVVKQLPDHPAIVTALKQISYSALDAKSDEIFRILNSFNQQEQPLYAILVEQGIASFAAILGVLKAGKGFIIFSPDTPLERLKAFWADAENPVIITNASCFPVAQKITSIDKIINLDTDNQQIFITANPVQKTLPEDTAAIFYTSGSTGEPKGVIWSHELVLHTAFLNYQSYNITPDDRIAILSAYGFGAAMTMSFAALLSGATVYFYSEFQQNPRLLINWIDQNKVTILSMTTTGLFRQIVNALRELSPLVSVRLVVLGGEDLYKSDVELFFRVFPVNSTLVYRLAGSETMLMREIKIDHSMVFSDDRIPVGYAVQDKELLLLSEDQKEIMDGSFGEIAIRSRYLSSGYWHKPELTAKKFIPDDVDPKKRIYLTGDLGRINNQGQLFFGGRKDNMVKIRGFSVQLEAIENELQELPGISEAIVTVNSGKKGSQLIAYLVSSDSTKLRVKQIKNALEKKLPGYSIPSKYCWLDEFPRTQTGKVDRNRLPDLSSERPELSTAYQSASNETEEKLVTIWKELLGFRQVGINDNFFELGGDSLMVLEMTLEVERVFHFTVPQSFFKDPTLASLSKLVDASNRQSESANVFMINSFPPEVRRSRIEDRKDKKKSKIKILLTRKYSKKDLDFPLRYFDRRIRNYLVTLTFNEAIAWSVRWSRNAVVRDVFYNPRKKLFSQWLAVLGDERENNSDLFQKSVLTNMFFNMPKAFKKKDKGSVPILKSYRESKLRYWHSLGDIIERSTADELTQWFPMKGLENLTNARKQGKGVILLSYHGAPHPGGVLPLLKILSIDAIPTISYQIPIRKSRYYDQRDQITETAAFTMNAEIALFGQKILLEGGIVKFVSDTNDIRGKTYLVQIVNRSYQIKSGFAEMALNTGAVVIPYNSYCLSDGKVQMEFFPPLMPDGDSRQTQVENMIYSYAAFIEQSWRTHPDALVWRRMKKHLERPVS